MAKYIYAVLLGLIGAVPAHILTVWLTPFFSSPPLWAELRRQTPAYQFVSLPPDSPIMRRNDPFFQIRLCRFNLAESPVHLTAENLTPYWSLAVYSPKGEILTSLSSADAPAGAVDILAVSPQDLPYFRHNPPEEFANSALTPLNDGENFAVLRALLPSDDWRERTEEFFAHAQCRRIEY